MIVDRDGEEVAIQIPGDFFKTLKKNKGAFIDCKGELYVKELGPGVEHARNAGLLAGDQITGLNDTSILSFGQFSSMLFNSRGKQVQVSVLRDGQSLQLTSKVDTSGIIGFRPEVKKYEGQRTAYTFGSAVKYAFKDSWDVIYYNVIGFGKVFSGEIKAQESVQSIVGIATLYGGTWEWGRFWKLTAMISLILAFMNALPIPALDGGHMVFLIYEMITGKPAPDKVLLIAQYIGMFLLLALMVLTIGNDIWRMVTGQ
jgi:regulator of sigma E protease